MRDLRPILLCNVVYKVISKVLANCLKPLLSVLISQEQSSFVAGRSIINNAMIGFEVVHYLKKKVRGNRGDMTIKIDISKAYDRVD